MTAKLAQAKQYLESLGITAEELHAYEVFLCIKSYKEEQDNTSLEELINLEEECYLSDSMGKRFYKLVRGFV